MSRAAYPRVGEIIDCRPARAGWGHSLEKRRGEPPLAHININTMYRCVVCAAPATRITMVQVSWFRGEDEAACTCDTHRRDLDAILEALVRIGHAKRAMQ